MNTLVVDAAGNPLRTDVVPGPPGTVHPIQPYMPSDPKNFTADDVQRMITTTLQHEFYVRDAYNAQRAAENKKKVTAATAGLVAAGVAGGIATTLVIQRIRRRNAQQANQGGGR